MNGRLFIAYAFSAIIAGLIITNGVIWGINFNLESYDKLYLIAIFLCIVICVSFALFTHLYYIASVDSKEYEEACRKRIVWLNSAIAWMIVHYWLIGASCLATLIVVYITVGNEINSTRVVFYSIMSLITSFLDMIIMPLSMSKGYRKAYEKIDAELVEMEYTNENLKKARLRGERFITKYTYDKR